MTATYISGPCNFKQLELPSDIKKESKNLVFSQMQDILSKVKKIGKIDSLSALSKEKEAIIAFRSKAIALHKFFSENIGLEDGQAIQQLQPLFDEIISETFELENKLQKKQLGPSQNPSLIAQLKLKQQSKNSSLGQIQPVQAKPLPQATTSKTAKSKMTPLQENLCILIKILRTHISTEGLFRLSGQATILKTLDVKKINEEVIQQIKDIHTIAGVLKKTLREMSPALLESIKDQLLNLDSNPEVEKLKNIVGSLSEENQKTLQMLIDFLSEVAANASNNKMTPANLAVCFVPNLFSQPQSMEEQFAQMQNSAHLNAIFTALIQNNNQIFG